MSARASLGSALSPDEPDVCFGLFAAVSTNRIGPSDAAGLERDQHAGTKHGRLLDLGECESWRTPLRASAPGVADLCFGDACLPESCKHRMLEFGDEEVARRAQRLALYWS